jgi:protein-tyrosine kinase
MESENKTVPMVLRKQELTSADRRQLELHQRQQSREEISRMMEPFRLDSGELAAMRLVDGNAVNTELGNAVRSLRQQILGKLGSRNGVIMVAGMVADGGASFVARNLAAALALDESRSSLLMDCDVSGGGDDALKIVSPDLPGLTDFLVDGRLAEADVIYPSGVPRMRLIPRGTQKVMEGEQFSSVRMQELLEATARRYPDRYLVVDVPPLKTSADASMLARYCDLIVLVVPYGKVMPAEIEQAIDTLGEERILGIVFNKEPRVPRIRP